MTNDEPPEGISGISTQDRLRPILKSQYHAALGMLRQGVERCPEDLWADTSPINPFWRIAYHALYFTHLYLQPKLESFKPWEHHQTGMHDLDDVPAEAELLEWLELPHRPPRTGQAYTKEQILAYWALCDAMVDAWVDRLDLESAESGFSWYPIAKLEHQIVNIRHLQHHAAQLGDRLRNTTRETGVEWYGRWPRPAQPAS